MDISRCLLMKGVASVTDDFLDFTYLFDCFFGRFAKRQIFLTVVGDHLHSNNLLSFAKAYLYVAKFFAYLFFRYIVTGFSARSNVYLNV